MTNGRSARGGRYGDYNPQGYNLRRGYGGNRFGFVASPDYNVEYRKWQLSDEAIEENIVEVLDTDLSIPSRDKEKIRVDVNNGIVTLSGTIQRRYSKWAAFNDVYWLPGVVDLDNRIKVETDKQQQRKQKQLKTKT